MKPAVLIDTDISPDARETGASPENRQQRGLVRQVRRLNQSYYPPRIGWGDELLQHELRMGIAAQPLFQTGSGTRTPGPRNEALQTSFVCWNELPVLAPQRHGRFPGCWKISTIYARQHE